jgi:hypothetical protein
VFGLAVKKIQVKVRRVFISKADKCGYYTGACLAVNALAACTVLDPLHLRPHVLRYMRFSVPNIPPAILSAAAQRNVPTVSSSEAVQRISSFLSSGRAAILTGAGVSVDSGVKAYRGKDGRYMNPDYKCAPSHASNQCYLTHVPNGRFQADFRGHYL